jgi:hypothetical protein
LPLSQEDSNFPFFKIGIQFPVFVLKFNNFIPFGLINQMVCFYGKFREGKRFWRDQLIFSFENKSILIRLDFNNLEIKVFASNKLNREEEKYIFYSIMALYWDTNPLEYDEIKKGTDSLHQDSHSQVSSEKQFQWDMKDRIFNISACFPDDLFISIDDNEFIHYKDFCDLKSNTVEIKVYPRNEGNPNTLSKEPSRNVPISSYQNFTNKQLRSMKKVFVSYSHEDSIFRKEVQKFLVNLEREKLIKIWQDVLINPGDIWEEEIQNSLENADIIILLVSQNFINSTYIYEKEMKKAIKKAEDKSAVIIPVLLKNCDWSNWIVLPEGTDENLVNQDKGKIGKYQFMPMDDDQKLKPIVKWANEEDAWMKLVSFIRKIAV